MSRFTPDNSIVSWGRVERLAHDAGWPRFSDEVAGLLMDAKRGGQPVLPVGLGRSYGDTGLNGGGALIDMTGLNRLIGFADGAIEAEAGISLGAISDFALPLGYFLPVTPGTQFVTLGGAIANDVHGKNHHGAGTIGRWVGAITLVRSDGSVRELVPGDALFEATIGGLGLTGVILSAKLALKPVKGAMMTTRDIAFGNLKEFFALDREMVGQHEYSVAWVDCMAGGRGLGRGIYSAADHASEGGSSVRSMRSGPRLPMDAPGFALNRVSVGMFNALKYRWGRMRQGRSMRGLAKYFYPLDGIRDWNRLYGRRGLYQHQSVVPPGAAEDAVGEMLRAVSGAGQGSPLAVLKSFGALASPGMLSFPMEGTTLALDFANRGTPTLRLLERLDAIVRAAGGRVYPAKDGRMSAAMFRASNARLDDFTAHVDEGMSSSFWRRMQE